MIELTAEQRMLIEWECTKLVTRYNLLNDSGQWEAAADCFAEDGSYLTPMSPTPVSGRQALIDSLSARPPWTFRHFVTNVVVDVISQREARGHSYVLVAFSAGEAPAATITGPGLTGDVEEHFVLTEAGWRFGHRRGLHGIAFGAQPA